MKSLPDYLRENLGKPIYESELEKYVYKLLLNLYSPHSIAREVKYANARGVYYADFVITTKNSNCQIIIEAKSTHLIEERTLIRLIERVYPQPIQTYFVLTDGAKALIVDKIGQKPKEQDFESFLSEQKTTQVAALQIENIKIKLHEAIEKSDQNIQDENIRNSHDGIKRMLHDYVESLKQDDIKNDNKDNHIFWINESKQREFYQLLLKKEDIKQVVKFSGARSLYNMLDNHTMNMCSLICMNDPSEKDYADTYLGTKEPVDNSANTFIISTCDINVENDLTMWRLYADDTKGICTRFDINTNKIGTNGFFLSHVSYATENGYHYELEIIKSIKDNIPNFVFNEWNIWKHFFKKNQYAIEREIRLLYFPEDDNRINEVDSKWFKDAKTEIYSEMKLFDLTKADTHFPFTLNAVVLGTNFPQKKDNAVQFNNRFAKSNIIRNVPDQGDYVLPSTIEDYR